MKFLIFGTGGIGGFFGAQLAKANNEVHFIARGDHLNSIVESGLKIKSSEGDYEINPAMASEDIPQNFVPDFIFLCTKTNQLSQSAKKIIPLINKNTTVVFFQNGVDNYERLSEVLPKENLLPASAQIVATITSPGEITHRSAIKKVILGEYDGQMSERSKKLHSLLEEANLDAHLSDNIQKVLWQKFIFISAFSGLTALTRSSIGPIMEDQDVSRLYYDCLKETYEVARSLNIDIDPSYVDDRYNFTKTLEANLTSSLLEDIKNEKPTELGSLNGAVVKIGKSLNLPTPINQFIYTALKLKSKGAQNSVC